MVCTSSLGVKVPLAYVGKSNNPRSFAGKVRPAHYTFNKKAWFNKGVTKWWFETVFIPFFTEHFQTEEGSTHGIVILDGCSAHNGIVEWLEESGFFNIHVVFLPPNVTSMYQPMDQGAISWVKKIYKFTLVDKLLKIYDDLILNAKCNRNKAKWRV